MWQVYFVNYYQSKNHKQRCKINELLYKVIGKSWLNTPIKALGSSVNFLTVRGRWEWKILAVWIAHFILFLFCNEPTKKIYGVHTLTTEPPPSPIRASTFLVGPFPARPPPLVRTYVLYEWSLKGTLVSTHFNLQLESSSYAQSIWIFLPTNLYDFALQLHLILHGSVYETQIEVLYMKAKVMVTL